MRFNLFIECDNDAFVPDPAIEVTRILRNLGHGTVGHDGGTHGTVRDGNGNTVGRWEYTT